MQSRSHYADIEAKVSGKEPASSSSSDTEMTDTEDHSIIDGLIQEQLHRMDDQGQLDPEGLPGPPADPEPSTIDTTQDACANYLDEDQNKRRRHFLGTINLGEEQDSTLPHWDELPPGVRFLSWQREKVTREHLQVFVEFTMNKTTTACLAVFGGGFWKPCKNSAKSISYCKEYVTKCCTACFKGNPCTGCERLLGPFTLGTSTSQGKRTDVDRLASAVVRTGYEQAFLKLPGTAIKYPSGAKEYHRILSKFDRGERFRPPRILTVIGAAGTNKTALRDMFRGYFDPENDYEQRIFATPFDAHIQDPESQWWDGYTSQNTIVLDDFYGQTRYSYFIKLIDGWPRTEAVKNSHVVLNNHYWIITSNSFPWNWYQFSGCKQALYDRLWGQSAKRQHWDTCVFDMDKNQFVPPYHCQCNRCIQDMQPADPLGPRTITPGMFGVRASDHFISNPDPDFVPPPTDTFGAAGVDFASASTRQLTPSDTADSDYVRVPRPATQSRPL